MQELAPRAIGLRLGFADGALEGRAEDRLLVVLAFELRPMLVAPVDAQDFFQRVAGRLAAGTVERRDDRCVFDIAHEIRSSPRPISPCGQFGATGVPVPRPPLKTAEIRSKLGPPDEGDNPSDITRWSSRRAIAPLPVRRKYRNHWRFARYVRRVIRRRDPPRAPPDS
jgi:hypothetical protein